MQITIGYDTIPAVADSDFLDRLAERIYEIEALGSPLLGLNEDGSVSASFDIEATDALQAVEMASQLFFDAFLAARPLRDPLPGELEAANQLAAKAANRLGAARQPGLLASISAQSSARLRHERENEAVPA
jgi:hypothetical protein